MNTQAEFVYQLTQQPPASLHVLTISYPPPLAKQCFPGPQPQPRDSRASAPNPEPQESRAPLLNPKHPPQDPPGPSPNPKCCTPGLPRPHPCSLHVLDLSAKGAQALNRTSGFPGLALNPELQNSLGPSPDSQTLNPRNPRAPAPNPQPWDSPGPSPRP